MYFIRKHLKFIIFGIPVLLLSIMGSAYFFQDYLIFRPNSYFRKPEEVGMKNIKLITVKTEDGEILNAWFKAPESVNEKVFLYFHGNSRSLARNTAIISNLIHHNSSILAIDYRGYGGSTGYPSIEGIYADARAAVRYLKENDITMDRVVVVGYSLGTAPAARTAATESIAGIIFISPYSTIEDVSHYYLPFAPVKRLLKHNFDAVADARKITAPTLVMHGTYDWLVPYRFGVKLFENIASTSKEMHTFERSGHWFAFDARLLEDIKPFLIKLSEKT